MFKKILKSKMMNLAVLLAALGTIQASTEVFAVFMTPAAYGVFTLIVGVAVAVLRAMTTTSLKDK